MERGALTAEILRRYTAGETCHEVARALGVSTSTVWTAAQSAGVSRSRRDAQLTQRRRKRRQIELLVVRCYQSGLSTYETADRLDVSQGMVARILRERNIPRRPARNPVRRGAQ